jgi:hypothetical protein
MTGRGIHKMSPGTQRAPKSNILIGLGMVGVFFVDPALNFEPVRRTLIEEGFHSFLVIQKCRRIFAKDQPRPSRP